MTSAACADAVYGKLDIPVYSGFYQQIKWLKLCTSLHEHNSSHVFGITNNNDYLVMGLGESFLRDLFSLLIEK